MSKCIKCKFWVYSETLSSMPDKEWHCRDGFSPRDPDCQQEAERNLRMRREYYRKHPEELQMKLRFKQ